MIEISKYKEAVGIWKHTIGSITHELVPEEDDNYRFLQAKEDAQKKDDGTLLYKGVAKLYFEMVVRAKPALSEEDQKELKNWIGVNVNQIVEDFLIAFRWTTSEGLDKIKKKLESPSETIK